MPRSRELKTDFLIIGGGIAGLSAALTGSQFGKVTLLTKGRVGETATGEAQGGIAAAIDQEKDSTLYHYQDTLEAGAGLCDPAAVKILVEEGVERVKELISWGARFDRGEGGFELAQEGAHRQRRILHAGDTTGREVERTLGWKVLSEGKVEIKKLHFGQELLVQNGKCVGATVLDLEKKETVKIFAKATLLATGGLGQVYLYTTNPVFATGDGVAMAYRAGVEVSDLEFIQFHPTALVHRKDLEDIIALPQFLISEAVRGEGGILLNSRGERFMEKYHSRAELAPRDVVARAIFEEMEREGADHVNLSLIDLPPEKITRRFPHIYETCRKRGLDITRDPIPVAPAAHYSMGGVKTDLDGQTSLPGLFAAGEVAALGIHGANRLASNSLLDGLVFGNRSALAAKKLFKSRAESAEKEPLNFNFIPESDRERELRQTLKVIMWKSVGLVRRRDQLEDALLKITGMEEELGPADSPSTLELANILLVSRLITQASLDRRESRGAHYRTDYPRRDDAFKKHLTYKGG